MSDEQWPEMAERFLKAHANPVAGFDAALGELKAGRKEGHWIWYIFPQLEGLGTSSAAQWFALADVDQAWAFASHVVLGAHLLQAIETVNQHPGTLHDLMVNPVDVRKLVSSLTLFWYVCQDHMHDREVSHATRASELTAACYRVLKKAADQGIPQCAFTIQALA